MVQNIVITKTLEDTVETKTFGTGTKTVNKKRDPSFIYATVFILM